MSHILNTLRTGFLLYHDAFRGRSRQVGGKDAVRKVRPPSCFRLITYLANQGDAAHPLDCGRGLLTARFMFEGTKHSESNQERRHSGGATSLSVPDTNLAAELRRFRCGTRT